MTSEPIALLVALACSILLAAPLAAAAQEYKAGKVYRLGILSPAPFEGREMRRRLAELNARRARAGKPPLRNGIGIHTGIVLAGNIGSAERLTYALVGDVKALVPPQSPRRHRGTDRKPRRTTFPPRISILVESLLGVTHELLRRFLPCLESFADVLLRDYLECVRRGCYPQFGGDGLRADGTLARAYRRSHRAE